MNDNRIADFIDAYDDLVDAAWGAERISGPTRTERLRRKAEAYAKAREAAFSGKGVGERVHAVLVAAGREAKRLPL